ncbi:fluoride efflux transporter CrcB [Lacibacterium aquatile]|uniref:Fluoride-specific ion channel FluC n=1 Tax=Lacibacterium aquatile TaxID=1168082 RepID=A0ABW5DRU0_9PROT
MEWLAVAIGGAVGSVARYEFAKQVTMRLGTGFPWGILAINVIGSFVMGVMVAFFALVPLPQTLRVGLTTGILGGFTTFSTFSLDVATLMERGQTLLAAVYVVASVGLGVGGLFAGKAMLRIFG